MASCYEILTTTQVSETVSRKLLVFRIITSFLVSFSAASRSYVFSSLASAAVSFATGAFGMWIPLYLARAQVVQKTAEACTKAACSSTDR